VDTFDFVTVQLYEGYSHAEYNTTVMNQAPEVYLDQFVRSMVDGWSLHLPQDLGLPPSEAIVQVPSSKLVVGLANGWAGDGKFLLIYPDQVGASYHSLEKSGLAPRGYAFWCIKDEGLASPSRPNVPVWMAAGLNDFLRIRPTGQLL
jgi:hypothetical protein